ncbi:hypothetical protein [uncultured Roseovarius sp.]|uniref:hypothetical protein n=1 Tax=uncultured Roseovarius sp. TaxID=293344 RepID=UPI00262B4213|nr:hypothetical protein [uncultured Roseovarius sp.]
MIPSLEELGGVEAILGDREAVISSPFLDVLLECIRGGSAQDQTLLLDLVAEGFLKADKPAVFRDAANVLLADPELRLSARPKLVEALVQRVEERQSGKDALIAAYALEALFRLGLEDRRTRLRTLLLIDGLTSDDDGLFAKYAARIVGVAYHQWGDIELRDVLIRLQANDEAADDAAFELAMVALANALNAVDVVGIDIAIRDARGLFMNVLRRDASRLDAAVQVAVIDIILSFSTDTDNGLSDQIEKLGRLLTERYDQLGVSQTPDWLKPRLDREAEWWSLLRLLRSVDGDLGRESWRHAAKVMEQVLFIYDAERTVAIGDALHTLFAPRIEAAFIRRKGLAAHLHDLLDDEEWTSTERPVAEALRERLVKRAEESFSARLVEEDGAFPELSAVLQDHDFLSQVPADMARRLESALTDKVSGGRGKMRPDVQRICRAITEDFADASDYRDDVRVAFDELVQKTVIFCEDRQNADLAQAGDNVAYLRSANAIENDLQRDLRVWLRATMPAVNILTEVPGIAIGRSDLYVDFGDVQFVIELKRHEGVVNDAVARDYRAQAVAYQATGPKLGMLGILELVDRPGPPPSLVECVWTNSYVPEGSDLVRHLVVFRVPGMLKTPSKMK